MLNLPPLSLYIHLPWCERKCPYCDFNSHENKNDFNEELYIQCLIEDFKLQLNMAQGRKLQSIFIGGGTPSLFKVENIDRLLQSIKKNIDFEQEIEITLEANPASSQANYFSALAQTLVNRVSLGVQSFQTDKLATLGRLHSAQEASLALEALKNNFDNFNIDLMFALPQQTIKDCLFDLQQALDFSPPHLSWYQLTIEPNTVFFRTTPILPNDDLVYEMQIAGNSLLAKNNLQQYEISAFSRATKQSKHNLNYWLFGDYLAIGAGAHGKITHVKNNDLSVTRFQKTRVPKDYMKAQDSAFTAKEETVNNKELALEFFMNSLRLQQSIPFALFYERTGLAFSDIEYFCAQARSLKLITFDEHTLTKTALGHKHVDTLLGLF